MGIVLTERDRIRRLEAENRALREENDTLRATVDYIAVCDHPEIFEEDGADE